jgi:hypothetical protein
MPKNGRQSGHMISYALDQFTSDQQCIIQTLELDENDRPGPVPGTMGTKPNTDRGTKNCTKKKP